MAEKNKNKKPGIGNELLSQNFLGDSFKRTNQAGGFGGNLFNQLARLQVHDSQAPIVASQQKQMAWQPIINMINTAEEQRRSRLAAYIQANPMPDESQLFQGTGDLVNATMQKNNNKFREVNKKLTFMNADHPEYAGLVSQMNMINETTANLKTDNDKLIEIKNQMIAEGPEGIEERTKGLGSKYDAMYDDILAGRKDNFQVINGKIHWVNPNAKDNEQPIAISDIPADTDHIYKNSFAEREHLKLDKLVMESKMLDPKMLNHRVKTLFKLIGNKGVNSMIFDADDNSGFYNSQEWLLDWLTSQGITPMENGLYTEEAINEFNRIKEEGVLSVGKNPQFGSVKNHFAKWYTNKLMENKGALIPPPPPSENTSTITPGALDFDLEEESSVENNEGNKKEEEEENNEPWWKRIYTPNPTSIK